MGIGAVCVMFGVLWLRALARVRRNIMERVALSRHVDAAYLSLTPEEAALVLEV